MSFHALRKPIYSALVFLATVLIGSITYAAYQNITESEYATGQLLSSSLFGKVVSNIADLNTRLTSIETGNSGIPSWAVMSFNLTNCPTGWSNFTNANGKVVVWVGNDGQWNTYSLLNTWGEARHTLTVSEMPSHSHGFSIGTTDDNVSPWNVALLQLGDNGPFSFENFVTLETGGSQSHENRMPYLALLYCVKN